LLRSQILSLKVVLLKKGKVQLARQLAEQDFLQLDLVARVVHVDAHESPIRVVIQNNAL
jgi:hypothetical protein